MEVDPPLPTAGAQGFAFFSCSVCAQPLLPANVVTLPCGYSVHRQCLVPSLVPDKSCSAQQQLSTPFVVTAPAYFKCPVSTCKRTYHPLPEKESDIGSDTILSAVLEKCMSLAAAAAASAALCADALSSQQLQQQQQQQPPSCKQLLISKGASAQCALFRALGIKKKRAQQQDEASPTDDRKGKHPLFQQASCSATSLASAPSPVLSVNTMLTVDRDVACDRASDASFSPPPSPGPVGKAIDSFMSMEVGGSSSSGCRDADALPHVTAPIPLTCAPSGNASVDQCAPMDTDLSSAHFVTLQRKTLVSQLSHAAQDHDIGTHAPVPAASGSPLQPPPALAKRPSVSSTVSSFSVATTATGQTACSSMPKLLQPLSLQFADFEDLLECKLCYNLMYEPITFFPCGHTACRACVLRTLDYSVNPSAANASGACAASAAACFYCRAQLQDKYLAYHFQPPTHLLQQFILTQFPAQFKQRLLSLSKEIASLMEEVPIFICSLALPGQICHLHVFEPRYRLMMRRITAPGAFRLFGMCLPCPSGGPVEYGVMLRVERIEFLHDGRSIVEAVGVYTFKIISQRCKDGYCVARVQQMVDSDPIRLDDVLPPTTLPVLSTLHLSSFAPQPDAPSKDSSAPPAAEGGNTNGDLPGSPVAQPVITLAPTYRDLLCYASLILRQFLDRLPDDAARNRFRQQYGCMPCCPTLFTYWCANILPLGNSDRYQLLTMRSARARLGLVLRWSEEAFKRVSAAEAQPDSPNGSEGEDDSNDDEDSNDSDADVFEDAEDGNDDSAEMEDVAPIIAVIGVAVGGAGWYITRLARHQEVVWTRDNPHPWLKIEKDMNTKMMNVNENLKSNFKREW
ncbi:hypothetical protein RI367_001031 [Sorochytrium milnesiophthora]